MNQDRRVRDKHAVASYRNRARELYERGAVTYEPHRVLEQVKISLYANVQVCEGGAFVEAVVWVPEEQLEKPCTHEDPDHTGLCIHCGAKA